MPPRPPRRGANRLDVALVVGPGVDHQAGIGAVEVGVGARQRHRARIGREDPLYLGVARGEVTQ